MNDPKREQPDPRRNIPDADRDIGTIPIAGKPTPAKSAPAKPAPATASAPSSLPHNSDGNRRHRSSPPLVNRLLPTTLGISGLLIAYLILSQLGVALFLPRLLANHWDQQLGRPVTIARAQWRPLSLTLVLHNGIIGPHRSDPHDHLDPLLSFRTLRAKLNPGTLFFGTPRLTQLEVEQPFLHLLRDEEGRYNLEWLVRLALERPWQPRELLINNGRLLYSDRGYRHPGSSTPPPGEFRGELREITGGWRSSRMAAPGPPHFDFALDAAGPQGATIRLQGLMASESSSALELKVTINEFPLSVLADYLQPLLSRNIEAGRFSLQASFSPLADGELAIEQQLAIRGLELGSPPNQQDDEAATQLLLALLSNREQLIELKLPMTIPADRRDSPYLRELAATLEHLLEQARFTPLTLLADEQSDLTGPLDFAPGSATLSREAKDRLDRLAAVLENRPLLKLEIGGPLPPLCDREALRKQREEQLREERRQAVATLARELADGSEITVSAARLAALRPENAIVTEDQLLALATARRQAVQQRLLTALEQDGQTPQSGRFRIIAPTLEPQPSQDQPECGWISLKLVP